MEKIKSGSKIAEYIYDDYIQNRDFMSKDQLLKNIGLLVENDLAVKISGRDYVDISMDRRIQEYRVISEFMVKHDKSLKNKQFDYKPTYTFSDIHPEIRKLMEYQLDIGTYYLDLSNDDNSDYAVCIINPVSDDLYAVDYELYFIGYRCNKFKKKLMKKIKHYESLIKQQKRERIYYSDGRPSKETVFKSFDQMVFYGKEDIIKYVDNWVENIPKYVKYGMVPKLSILLYGSPGTGKSTFYKALAKHLGIESINVVTPDYFMFNSNNQLQKPRRARTLESINVIDDIDCISRSREDDTGNENGRIMSSLLEFLDNPPTFYFNAKDGLTYNVAIVVATTNYIDRLDEAVKRYGRFDLKIEMKPFDYKEAKEMCSVFDLSIHDVITGKIDKNNFSISPAQLQALCMENIDKALKGTVNDK